MKHIFLFFLIVPAILLGATKLPELEPKDVSSILKQIMERHVTYKKMSPQLVERGLTLFIESLDPVKTYFLEQEVQKWLTLQEPALTHIVEEIEQGDYSTFEGIHSAMCRAIERRKRLEDEIKTRPHVENVSFKEFKEIKWAQSEEELKERLLRIRSLQTKAARALESSQEETAAKLIARISKKRDLKEEEILSKDKATKKKFVLTHTLKALASAFDPNTAYFTPLEAAQFMIQVQQRLFGIGVQLRDDLSGFSVVKIIENSPASTTDLREKDRIIAINNEIVVGMEITDVVELIRGEEGSLVKLTVLRQIEGGEEKREISVTRGEIVVQEARITSSTVPFGDGVIATIALHAFYQDPQRSSAGDVYDEIARIRQEHKIKGLILDLRSNPGGVLPQAVAVSGLFITKGIVVGVKNHIGKVEYLREIDGKTVYDGPLVVLTNKASASAAEIVAQTLQDYGRAIVVGDEHTYGKGTCQEFTLDGTDKAKVNPKGEIKVTQGRYYTVSGKSPQLVGVKPDIIVPGPFSTLDIGEMHVKYALEGDNIEENFRDDLSDIPLPQREQVSWLYRFNLQPKLRTYTRYLPILQENSKKRLEGPLYKYFLSKLSEEERQEDKSENLEILQKCDLQLDEAHAIVKDLALLLHH